jgi:hypothetical protein
MASKSDITKLQNSIDSITILVNNLTTKFDNMENRLPAIFDTLNKLETQLKAITVAPTADEKERKRSIVVTRLPESEKSKPSEKSKDDHQALTNVLDLLGVESSFVSYRMGNLNPTIKGYVRPIKVIFPARKFQIQALKEWTNQRDAVRKLVQCDNFAMRWSESEEERTAKMAKRKQTEGGDSNITQRSQTNR